MSSSHYVVGSAVDGHQIDVSVSGMWSLGLMDSLL